MNGPRRALIASMLIPIVGCGPKAEKAAEGPVAPKPITVTVAEVESRPIERTVDVVGNLKGWEEVTVGAKRFGRVARVRHDIGDRVKPGELLVQFETIDADLAIDQAEKQLLAELAKIGVILKAVPSQTPSVDDVDVMKLPSIVQMQVALDRARTNLAREKSLMSKGAGMKQDLQNTEADVHSAEAALDNAVLTARSTIVSALAAKVGLDVRKQSRVDLEIQAPTPSRPPLGLKTPVAYAVSKRSVSEGQMIREGDPVFELVVENPLRLWLNVPERFAAEVKPGQDVRIEVASYGGETFAGKLTRISPIIDSASRTFQVEAAVPNDTGKLRPGGFVKARIVTDRDAKATVVPLDAIVRFAGVTKLFLLGDDAKSHAVAVETGKEGPGWVEVLGAKLPDKARVITTGQGSARRDKPAARRRSSHQPAGRHRPPGAAGVARGRSVDPRLRADRGSARRCIRRRRKGCRSSAGGSQAARRPVSRHPVHRRRFHFARRSPRASAGRAGEQEPARRT